MFEIWVKYQFTRFLIFIDNFSWGAFIDNNPLNFDAAWSDLDYNDILLVDFILLGSLSFEIIYKFSSVFRAFDYLVIIPFLWIRDDRLEQGYIP